MTARVNKVKAIQVQKYSASRCVCGAGCTDLITSINEIVGVTDQGELSGDVMQVFMLNAEVNRRKR